MLNTYLPQILIFLGVLLTFLGGLISFNRDEETQKENKALVVENNRLIESNLSLSELIKNNITGGNSFGVVSLISVLDNNDEDVYLFYFENKGDFPMYDVTLKYWEVEDIKAKVKKDGRATTEIFNYYNPVDLGNVASKSGQAIGTYFKVKEGELLKINININAKNGMFSQLLRITKKNGKLCVAKRVNTVGENSKIIFEESDTNFPKDNNGNVIWE